MQKWKVGNRVKIEDSNIEEPVRVYLDHSNDNIRRDAEKLLNYWKDRPTVFRIPRKVHVVSPRRQ
jgi:histone-lysine N-methyltransferase SETD2